MTARARSWRKWQAVGACVASVAIAVTVVSPRRMAELPAGMRTPVVAFELARTPAEVERMFGAAGSPQRGEWRARMRLGVWLDFALLLAYGVLLAGMAQELGASASPRRARAAAWLALAAAGFDALENRALLAILDALGGEYGAALAQLAWFTWAKWLALGAYFALLAPALSRVGGVGRAAAVAGVVGAVSAVLALLLRGALAELMAVAIAAAITLLVVATFLPMRSRGTDR
jgi:hypothetical protein